MVENLPDVPPVVPLLVYEVLAKCSDWTSARTRLRSLLPELRIQSEAYAIEAVSRRVEARARPTEFDIHVHGALNLFDQDASCGHVSHRLAVAHRVSRSLGLIADHVWLTDHLSDTFIEFGRPTNAKLEKALVDAIVIAELWPLIHAGVVRFRSPWFPACASCTAKFGGEVQRIAGQLEPKFRSQFKLSRNVDGSYIAETGNCFEPKTCFHSFNKGIKRLPTARAFAQTFIEEQVRTAFWIGREAAITGGSVLSNSRIGLAGLLHQEGRFRGRRHLGLLDAARSVDLPWVSELKPTQVIELRQEAAKALPALREHLGRVLCGGETGASPNGDDVVAGLRQQAQEVRAELEIARRHSARYWKVAYGLLGFGISAYGVATDQALAGVGGLLPLIQLMMNHVSGQEKDVARLTHKPGYVLVKAQDILERERLIE